MSLKSLASWQSPEIILRDYPPNQLGYNTLDKPSTFTAYCYVPDCPKLPFPIGAYDPEYTKEQLQEEQLGLSRYLLSRQYERDENLNNFPVLNSNWHPLPNNFTQREPQWFTPGASPWRCELGAWPRTFMDCKNDITGPM